MAKFRGKVGFVEQVEQSKGVWVDVPHEHEYTMDLLRSSKQSTSTGEISDKVTLSNRVSLILDDFAHTHQSHLKYVIVDGAYWKVTSVEIQRPRLIMTFGGVYNGPKASGSS